MRVPCGVVPEVSTQGDRRISLLVEDGVIPPERHVSRSSVGVDGGATIAVATSDGHLLDRQFLTPGGRTRYRRLQHKLARQVKRSHNGSKTLHRMRVLRGRERQRRKDFCTQLAAHHTRGPCLRYYPPIPH
jgi:putative transposase